MTLAPLLFSATDAEPRLRKMRPAAVRAARGTGQAGPVGKGVAAGETCWRVYGQALAVGGETPGEMGEMPGHGLLGDTHLL